MIISWVTSKGEGREISIYGSVYTYIWCEHDNSFYHQATNKHVIGLSATSWKWSKILLKYLHISGICQMNNNGHWTDAVLCFLNVKWILSKENATIARVRPTKHKRNDSITCLTNKGSISWSVGMVQ